MSPPIYHHTSPHSPSCLTPFTITSHHTLYHMLLVLWLFHFSFFHAIKSVNISIPNVHFFHSQIIRKTPSILRTLRDFICCFLLKEALKWSFPPEKWVSWELKEFPTPENWSLESCESFAYQRTGLLKVMRVSRTKELVSWKLCEFSISKNWSVKVSYTRELIF